MRREMTPKHVMTWHSPQVNYLMRQIKLHQKDKTTVPIMSNIRFADENMAIVKMNLEGLDANVRFKKQDDWLIIRLSNKFKKKADAQDGEYAFYLIEDYYNLYDCHNTLCELLTKKRLKKFNRNKKKKQQTQEQK